jgi:dTDP-4-dehydrorhamnose reductase
MTERRSRPRILVTGAAGQVGWELVRTLAPLGEVTAPPRAELNLEDADAIRGFVRSLAPAVVVNAAAYTAVDSAEAEPDRAQRVNAAAPGVLAGEAAAAGALLVHFSTDYVFDGTARRPYREDDSRAPLNVYGRSKADGEDAVARAGGAHVILRTSWVYGLRGRNFLRTMLRAARERDELRVVNDQVGAPTWSRMVAEATAALLARMGVGSGGDPPPALLGTFHLAAGGETTWHGFTEAIVALDPVPDEHRCRRVVAVPSSEYPTPARRPAYSVLDSGRLRATAGIELPHWREQLVRCLETPGPSTGGERVRERTG